MAEKLWNMLKLLPSIAASRKNSLITGLARIDDNTEELILSLYHLPDPGDFLSVKEATYFAWAYDGEAKEYKKIGELQRKNGLTFGFRKKVALSGDGVFVTAELKGQEVHEPGTVILASNPELFYTEVAKREPEKPVIIENDRVEFEYREIPVHVESEEIPAIEEKYEEPVHEIVAEPTYREEIEPVIEKTVPLEQEIPAEPQAQPAFAGERKSVKKEEVTHEETTTEGINLTSERVKKLFTDFYSELPGDEVMAIIKDRYHHLKDEVNLKEYWEQCKKYMHDFYEETKLHVLFDEIKKDFKYLADKIGLDDMWDNIEKLVMDMIKNIDPKYWMHKIKCWLVEVDMQEWYGKAKKYVNAILDEVDPVVLWGKIKQWMENLFERMNIDEIIVWVQVKFRNMRLMNVDELKEEASRLLKQFVDALKLPELKMAVMKVTIREKLGQVGNFFQKVKDTVESSTGKSTQQADERDKSRFTPREKMNPYFAQRNPQTQNIYSNQQHAQQKPSKENFTYTGKTVDYAQMNSFMTPPTNPYDYSYFYKPTFEQTKEQNPVYPMQTYGYPYVQSQYVCPYMQSMYMQNSSWWPCGYCRGQWSIGKDAMGNPRYVYQGGDEGYYFITPDGEIISKS